MVKSINKLIDVLEEEIKDIIHNYHEGKTNDRGFNETEKQNLKNVLLGKLKAIYSNLY